MAITILNDRVELSSVFANTSSIGGSDNTSYATAFYNDNAATTFTIPSEYIGNTILTDTANNPIKVIGVNQQTGQRYTASFNSNQSTVYGSDWDEGYYKIYVRQFIRPSNGIDVVNNIDNCSFYEITKKDLFWNRSILSFMTFIQPGEFWMGALENEYGRIKTDNREKLHKVEITKGFYIARTVMTNYFWNSIMNGIVPADRKGTGSEDKTCTSGSNTYPTCFSGSSYTPAWYQGTTRNNNPRANISYSKYNARPAAPTNTGRSAYYGGFGVTSGVGYPVAYITGSYFGSGQAGNEEPDNSLLRVMQTKLGKSGYAWDLPTEAEWEFFCRASTKSAFNNGENLKFKTSQETGGSDDTPQPNINEICWFNTHNNAIHPVAMLKPNLWGLFDCHGDVWEWCKDWYATNIWNYNIYSSIDPILCEGYAPLNNSSIIETGVALQNRVLRGGGYTRAARFCRSAFRFSVAPSSTYNYYGFRPALRLTT